MQGNIEGADMTVSMFVATKFLPEHITAKTTSGKRHYQAILKHVLRPGEVDLMFGVDPIASSKKLREDISWPYLGGVFLQKTEPEHVQNLVYAAMQRGYSPQTIRHIRNVVGAIFSHAIRERIYIGENPARAVMLPGMKRRESHALTLAQTLLVLGRMQYPEREITLMALLTSMTIAEICGLQWKNVNLSDHLLSREGQFISKRSIAVRSQWYRGELCPIPDGRRKEIAIPSLLLTILKSISRDGNSNWNDFVLCTKNGRPINQINLAARRLKQLGRHLDMPWISWQVLRRTRARLCYEYGVHVQDHLATVLAPPPSGSTLRAVKRISSVADE
jgi:integrase